MIRPITDFETLKDAVKKSDVSRAVALLGSTTPKERTILVNKDVRTTIRGDSVGKLQR